LLECDNLEFVKFPVCRSPKTGRIFDVDLITDDCAKLTGKSANRLATKLYQVGRWAADSDIISGAIFVHEKSGKSEGADYLSDLLTALMTWRQVSKDNFDAHLRRRKAITSALLDVYRYKDSETRTVLELAKQDNPCPCCAFVA
jgi:hypothetical protein